MSATARRWRRTLHSAERYGARFGLAWRQRLMRRGACLFVSAMPKSASSFLVKALAETTGFVELFLGYDHRNEQDLYPPRLIDAWGLDVVTHQHMRVTPANLDLLREFRIRPVVLRRDLADALVSLCDHLERESLETSILNMPAAFRSWPRRARLDAVIDLAAPWYLQFHAGWARAVAAGEVEALSLDYAQLSAAPAEAVAQVLRFHGIDRPTAEIAAGVERARAAGLRFNRGVAGRGREELDEAQRRRLAALGQHFPDVDLSAIGLASPAPADRARA